MSAVMVSRLHIHCLVAAGFLRLPGEDRAENPHAAMMFPLGCENTASRLSAQSANEIGQMLVDANLSSVIADNGAHPDCIAPSDVASYQWPGLEEGLTTPAETLNAISCYEYQAEEHPEWSGSRAQRYCTLLRKHAAERVPGYEEAEWLRLAERIAERSGWTIGGERRTRGDEGKESAEGYAGCEKEVLYVTAVNWRVPIDFTQCPGLGPDVATTRVPAIALRNDHPEAMTPSSPLYTGLRPLAERNALRMRSREVRRAAIAAGTRLVARSDQRPPKAGEDPSTRYAIVDAVQETPDSAWRRVVVRWVMESGDGAQLRTSPPGPENRAEAPAMDQAPAPRAQY